MRRVYRTPNNLIQLMRFFSYSAIQHAPRRVYSPASYPTPTRNNIILLPKKATPLDWINAYQENIIYLAQWRVHLFFLLLIAYYKKQRAIQIAPTTLQYGKGHAPHIQAAHASLFPALYDCDLRKPSRTGEYDSIIDDSFLRHWNNMTVTCPVISNEFDTFLEGRGSGSLFRQHALFLLTICSLGRSDPILCLIYFLRTMALAIKNKKLFVNTYNLANEKKAAEKAIVFQGKGLFQFCSSDEQYIPYGNYIERVLLWDKKTQSRETAYSETQALLLTGHKKDAREFLKRFQPEKIDQESFLEP